MIAGYIILGAEYPSSNKANLFNSGRILKTPIKVTPKPLWYTYRPLKGTPCSTLNIATQLLSNRFTRVSGTRRLDASWTAKKGTSGLGPYGTANSASHDTTLTQQHGCNPNLAVAEFKCTVIVLRGAKFDIGSVTY